MISALPCIILRPASVSCKCSDVRGALRWALLLSATGMVIDEAGLKKIVNRSRNLHRAFNNLRGLSQTDEKPPEDHWRHRFPELEENLLMTYYKFKGWNHNGVPTRERLEELDLADVAQVLEERGILKNGQD